MFPRRWHNDGCLGLHFTSWFIVFWLLMFCLLNVYGKSSLVYDERSKQLHLQFVERKVDWGWRQWMRPEVMVRLYNRAIYSLPLSWRSKFKSYHKFITLNFFVGCIIFILQCPMLQTKWNVLFRDYKFSKKIRTFSLFLFPALLPC